MKEVLESVSKEDLKEICTSFFYWWYNQPGSNTEQGFDQWYEEKMKQHQD